MRKSVGLVLVFIFLAACIVTMPVLASAEDTENTWVSKASMHVARRGVGVVAVDGRIYAIGGNGEKGLWAQMKSTAPQMILGCLRQRCLLRGGDSRLLCARTGFTVLAGITAMEMLWE